MTAPLGCVRVSPLGQAEVTALSMRCEHARTVRQAETGASRQPRRPSSFCDTDFQRTEKNEASQHN